MIRIHTERLVLVFHNKSVGVGVAMEHGNDVSQPVATEFVARLVRPQLIVLKGEQMTHGPEHASNVRGESARARS